MRLSIALLLASAAWAQSNTATQPPGSIRGILRDAESGAAAANLFVWTTVAGKTLDAITDSQGRFRFDNLPPGKYRIAVTNSENHYPLLDSRPVTLDAGQTLDSLDFSIFIPGSITGKVIDHNKEPVPDAWVFLLQRTYQHGAEGYGQVEVAVTDDQGRYQLKRTVTPGRAYLIMAKRRVLQLPAISSAPAEPELRKQVMLPTLYPNSDSFVGAQSVTIRSGENREGVDIQVARAKSYCAEGTVEAAGTPAPLRFQINEKQPSNGPTNLGGSTFVVVPNGKAGDDGKFRFCELHPGQYEINALQAGSATVPWMYGTYPLSIGDKDVAGLKVVVLPSQSVAGEIVWDGDAPAQPVDAKLSIDVAPTRRAGFASEHDSIKSTLPGSFTLSALADEFSFNVSGLPKGFYLKDVTYGNDSILVAPLRMGSALGNAGVKVKVARDGGTISARVNDKDGKPVQSATVWIVPAGALTAAAAEPFLAYGQTDETGMWTSNTLRPGKYYALATLDRPDRSAETIDKLWRARIQATEVMLDPSGTAQVTLEVRKLE